MQAIRYRITSLSPLLFSSNTGDPNMVATLDYIPGTHLRGMIANEFIKRKGLGEKAHEDEKFYRWFLKGDIKTTNGYIVQERNGEFYRNLPIPFSIQKEKGKETFYDLLFQNKDFDKQTKAVFGFATIEEGEDENKLIIKGVKKSLNFHHARDREKGVSKEGQIFNYESINEGQVFEGFIIGKEDDLRELTGIISDGVYYIGRSRNNQYGKIRFEILSKEPEEFHSEVKIEEEPKDDIVLTLLSDTIIYNEMGFSTTDLRELEKLLNCKIIKSFIKQSDEEGFISVWKLKTPSEICFKAGSCFLLEGADMEKLKELQKTGIGLRTHEGFGRFIIGLQKENDIKLKDENDEEYRKPNSPLSEKTNELIKKVIEEYLKNNAKIEAIKKAGDFEKLPPKSLLSKIKLSILNRSFENLINNIKQTAREHLERCHNKKENLHDFLKYFSIEKEINFNINELEINYEPEMDEKLKEELKKIYLSTLLSTMRKKIKQKEQDKGR
jgi:CRISPR-associated protein Csx10